MIDLLQSALAFILALGVLITFHEFGHYWVARRFNVKILRFSIGFGRPLYKRVFGPDATEFVIAALPLGGYVKMLDEREAKVRAEERPRAFNAQPLGRRFAIVAAGPLFNFIFAVFAYFLIFSIGVSGPRPIVGEVRPGSPAGAAGLAAGHEIVAVDGRAVATWPAALEALVGHTVKGGRVGLLTVDRAGLRQELELDLGAVSIDEMAGGGLPAALGFGLLQLKLPAIIGRIIPDGAAQRAGLMQYDEIVGVNGEAVRSWEHWVRIIRANPGAPLSIEVLRGGATLGLSLTPERVRAGDRQIGRIGAVVFQPDDFFASYFAQESYPPLPALHKALRKTWEMSLLTLRVLGKMLIGEASVKNLSGPISIAQYAGQSAGVGLVAFLGFMAIVSVSLGVLNLLPIPLLDGGHLLYYLVEFALGRPLSEEKQLLGQQMGLVVLLTLMGIAFYNDIARLLG